MMKGIRLGFCYKMRSLYAHFLISVVVQDSGSLLKSKISWVKKCNHRVRMRPGIACSVSQTQKDKLIFEGNDNELVLNSTTFWFSKL